MGLFGNLSDEANIAIGILVGLLSTSIQSLGLTLQRKSHLIEDEKYPHHAQRPAYRRRRWQLGMGMFVISNILGSTIQIVSLPLPVLSALQAAGLVFNSICATLILSEPFTRWSFGGTALVTAGAALIAIFGAIPSPTHSLRELLDLLGRWPFIVWMSLQAVLVIGIALTVDLLNFLTNLSQSIRFRLIRGLAFGCISGILSAHSLLIAKSAVELVVKTITDSDNQFVHWQSWVLVLGLVALALAQLYYLHRGLKLVSTSVLYPLVFCIYNIIAILDGLIYFKQTDLITPLDGGLIALGTVVLLSGVLALSWRLSDEQHPPGVGQSSLTPGLGLVDDSGGSESESLVDSDVVSDDDDRILPSYNTFLPKGDTASLRSTRKSTNPWIERAAIWDELEDHSAPVTPLNRQRSSTLPGHAVDENSALLGDHSGGGRDSMDTGGRSSMEGPRRTFRKRRKSTGFPGFTARKTVRRKSAVSHAGVQEALGGIWKLNWWRGKQDGEGGPPSEAAESTMTDPSESQVFHAMYADDVEADMARHADTGGQDRNPLLNSRRRQDRDIERADEEEERIREDSSPHSKQPRGGDAV